MTTSPSPAGSTSLAARIVFFVIGVATLTIGILITIGAALAGVIGIAIAARVVSGSGRRLTRRGAWFASVAGTIAVLAVLIGLVVLTDKSSREPITPSESRASARERLPEWMKGINPDAERRTAVADSVAGRLLQNRAVVVWAGLMGSVIFATMVGTIAGSFAWGGVMLVYRGYKGEWMPGSRPEPFPIGS
jgi:hypothetical protein